MGKSKKLTKKQSVFIDEYMADFNASRAAEASGFSVKGANHSGYRLLQNPIVMEELQKRVSERKEVIQLDRFYVIEKCKAILEADFFGGCFEVDADSMREAIESIPGDRRKYITGFEVIEKTFGKGEDQMVTKAYKFKFMSKDDALKTLGKHSGLGNRIIHDLGDSFGDLKNKSDDELKTKLKDLLIEDLADILKLGESRKNEG